MLDISRQNMNFYNKYEKYCNDTNYLRVKSAYNELTTHIYEFESYCKSNNKSQDNIKNMNEYPMYLKAIKTANELEKQLDYLKLLGLDKI